MSQPKTKPRASVHQIPVTPKLRARTIEAAQYHDLRSAWSRSAPSVHTLTHDAIRGARGRSRQAVLNDGYVRKYGRTVRKNVVGHQAVRMRSLAATGNGEPDEAARQRVEMGYRDFSRTARFTTHARMSRRATEAWAAETIKIDGECLLWWRTDARLPWGGAWQEVDAERLDLWLDRPASPGRNRIVMGVELDDLGRPVNYWLKSQLATEPRQMRVAPSDPLRGEHQVVPATDMVHAFPVIFAEQVRGIPATIAALTRAHDLHGWAEQSYLNARGGAMRWGYWSRPEMELGPEPGSDDPDAPEQDVAQATETIEDGAMYEKPAGWEWHNIEHAYPMGEYESFERAAVRYLATALDTFGPALAQDFSGVSLSSIRAGGYDDREGWKEEQAFLIERVCEPMHARWLAHALALGRLPPYDASDLRRLRPVRFRGRRWGSPEPLRDAQAAALRRSMLHQSDTEAIEEHGGDAEETWAQIREEAALRPGSGAIPSSMTLLDDPGTDNDTDTDGE